MGDVIQFRDYGTRPARPNNTKADRAFWMGHTERQGRGCYLTGPRAPDDLVMPCADPGIAGFDMTDFISDSGDCA